MNTEEVLDVTEAKRRARAEVEGYRERMRLEREAKAAAEETAEQEIARAIQRRRDDEAARAEIQAERNRIYAEREARLEELRKAEHEKRLAGEPRLRIAEHPARRVAKMLRQSLGDDFEAVLADIRGVSFNQLKLELARIPDDERAAAMQREREAQAAARAAAAAELPEPEDAAEAEILARYGFHS